MRWTPKVAAAAVVSLLGPVLGCAGARTNPSPVSARQASAACSMEQRLFSGGSFATMPDGVAVWFKVAGRRGAPTVVFLHGGPGYNAHTFEESSGRLLERSFQVVYLDQRGCGRSGFDGAPELYGMSRTVDDVERIRASIGVERLILLGHSFGGVVAAEYAQRHPEHVAAVVMIDTTPEIGRALEHQVETIDAMADARFPEASEAVHEIARGRGSPFDRLTRLYGLLGRIPIQSRLYYADPRSQARMDRIDRDSGIMGCTSPKVTEAFEREGYLLGPIPSVATRIPAPALLVAGRSSQVIGEDNLRRASEIWGAPIRRIDAGHFVYFEQPERFVGVVERFVEEAGLVDPPGRSPPGSEPSPASGPTPRPAARGAEPRDRTGDGPET